MAAQITQNVHGVGRISVKRRDLAQHLNEEPCNTVEVTFHLAEGGAVSFTAFTGSADLVFEGDVSVKTEEREPTRDPWELESDFECRLEAWHKEHRATGAQQ